MEKGNTRLTQGSVWKGIVSFAVPILLSNLFQQLYNTVDTAVVGRFAGSQALAAVGSTGSLINLFVGFFLGISSGTGVIFANAYGARDTERLKKVMNSALVLALGAGVILTVVGLLFTGDMLRLLHTPEDVFGEAVSYMRIYFGGSLFMMVYNIGAGIIQASGDSRRPLIYLVISGILNMLCDILCVAGFHMGAAGAAVATVFSQLIACILILVRLARVPESWHLKLSELRYDRATGRSIIRLAVPSGLQSCMFALSNILIQAKINAFGSTVMAGVAAYSRIDGFGFMPIQALGLSVTTFTSQNIGAGNLKRIRQGVRAVFACAAICVAVTTSNILLFSPKLLRLFTEDPEVIRYGLMQMWCLAPFEPIFAISEILSGTIRGAGKITPCMLIYLFAICVFRVIWLITLLPFFPHIRTVFIVYPVSWAVCTLVVILYYVKGKWRPALQAENGRD